jgi:hypothetical protein
MELEGAAAVSGTLHLAQAQSNRGAAGQKKKDFPDAERTGDSFHGSGMPKPLEPSRIGCAV